MERDGEMREVMPDVRNCTSNLIWGRLELEFDLVAREGTREWFGVC